MSINSLPNCVYGYADDLKVITSSLEEADQADKFIQQWSNDNDMVLSLNKSKILSVKGDTPNPESESRENLERPSANHVLKLTLGLKLQKTS